MAGYQSSFFGIFNDEKKVKVNNTEKKNMGKIHTKWPKTRTNFSHSCETNAANPEQARWT